ncbi:3-deoxy-D-manno-octulosonate 8-phosphate phosphatase (KDO 8-P phosphatase) [Gracilibacillus halotolerans]|uniref:3-deoxy-D-manno-octulosonate 8-phosphate phosphatase KdsC n=1 Tax=Gracilibacillus halotolerans TaxID=74386 RepID=A0A841RKZ5_9BACI|nr:HAD-IIIA family hydrolase [Gracilibacillus halotolerans]MBB6512293.1 3-deoxy-D-manno-octulosonate 8-phosphate phosphatase (KDO 8-P phosphatase) [Gracilibacillus halotolerans]
MREKAKKIKAFIMDVDGTLTDGKIYIGDKGEVFKAFNVKDGYGIKMLIENGITPIIITGRNSEIVKKRAEELNIKEVYQGIDNKVETYEQIKLNLGLKDEEFAFVGDDLNDYALMEKVGLKLVVNNCSEELVKIADYQSSLNGGEGAVRDVINRLLTAK